MFPVYGNVTFGAPGIPGDPVHTALNLNNTGYVELDVPMNWLEWSFSCWYNLDANEGGNPRLLANNHYAGTQVYLNNVNEGYNFHYSSTTNTGGNNQYVAWPAAVLGYYGPWITSGYQVNAGTFSFYGNNVVQWSATLADYTVGGLLQALQAAVPETIVYPIAYADLPATLLNTNGGSVQQLGSSTQNVNNPYYPNNATLTVYALQLNTWYHVVCCYGQGKQYLFHNGVLLWSQSNLNGGPLLPSTFPYNLGRNPIYNGDFVPGSLAHVAFYERVLTMREVRQLYAVGSAQQTGDYVGLTLDGMPRYYLPLADAAGSTQVVDLGLNATPPRR